MKRRLMAQQMATELFELEAAVDTALIKMASLAGRLPAMRMESNISAVVGQAAFDRTAKAYGALIQARQEVVSLHHELDEAKNGVGLRHVSYGGAEKDAFGIPPLQAVGTGRAA